jgi:hypothetical protein
MQVGTNDLNMPAFGGIKAKYKEQNIIFVVAKEILIN